MVEKNLEVNFREFPGGLVVRIPGFHCCDPRFNPWSGNRDPASAQPKKINFMARENSMKCEFQCSWIKIYWATATFMYLLPVYGCVCAR